MMFWKFAPSSNIDNLLDKEGLTLRELLADEEMLQECKGQNPKLIEFLCKAEHIEDLVDMVTLEPPDDENDAVKYKFPSLACEILTADISQINDVLDSEVVRKKLFGFLDIGSPINSLLASFFSKVVGILLSRKPGPTIEYIKSHDDFLALVLKHLGTSAIMDLLLRMVTCVEAADLRSQVLHWLNENNLVQRLIGLIDPAHSEELHCNSAQSLCDLIRLSREHMYTMQESAQEDPLLNSLEREETVSLLLHHMFDGELVESVIVNGISVLLALLEIRRPAPFGFPEAIPELTQLDVERLARGVSRTLHAVNGRLGDFHKLLVDPPKRDVMRCSFGELDPPLGNTRLHISKFLSAILMTNTHNINSQLADLKIFEVLLDLFFKYEYNNFLHTQVSSCVQTVLTNAANVPAASVVAKSSSPRVIGGEGNEMPDSPKEDEEELENTRQVAPLLAHLFEECRVIQRIMDAWDDNHRQENTEGGHRKGNMGHLTLITNYIVDGLEKGTNCDRLKRFVSEMPEEDQGRWQKFLAETLSELNERNSRELGGHNPMHFSSDEDNDDFRDVPFTSDSSLQQAYTDYQLQQMTCNFIDQFGFTDEDFAEPDDNIKFDKIETIDFDIKGDTSMSSNQLFEAVCKARVAHLDDNFDEEVDDNEDDDIWNEKPISFAEDVNGGPVAHTISTTPTVTVRHRSNSGSSTGSSGSSGSPVGSPVVAHAIKIPDAEMDMDTSQSPGWKATFDDSFDTSSSSSNENTPTSSPRAATNAFDDGAKHDEKPMDIGLENKEEAVSSSASDENWANFDSFNGNTVENSETVTSSRDQEQIASVDSTSEDKQTIADLNAGSPMAVTLTLSPGETVEHPLIDVATVSSSEDSSPEKQQIPQDVVMDDVSTTSESLPVDAGPATTSDLDVVESTVPQPESIDEQQPVDMDTSTNDESDVKRQKMETQDTEACEADSASAALEAVTSDNDEQKSAQSCDVTSSSGEAEESDQITSTESSVDGNQLDNVANAVQVTTDADSSEDTVDSEPDAVVANVSPVIPDPDTSTPNDEEPSSPNAAENAISPEAGNIQQNDVSSSCSKAQEPNNSENQSPAIQLNGPV